MELPLVGQYKAKDGRSFYLENLNQIDDSFYVLDLVESDKPDDIDAIATELTHTEWEQTKKSLGLVYVSAN